MLLIRKYRLEIVQFLIALFWGCILYYFFIGSKSTDKQIVLNQNPNILLIIADDAGWNDVGYNGSEIHTPNIDVLAKNGVQLNRFYVNPTCSPSRVSLLTGMPASRIGIVAPISGKSTKTLPDSITTLPQVLQKKNYQTALFGKWHLGLDIANGPNAFGFDYSYGFLHGQIDQYTHKYKNGDPSWYRNDKMITEEGHATDLITQEAINWLSKERNTDKNFFLQLAYSAPHFPLQEEEKWKKPYKKSIKNESRRVFAAAMSHMDASIGEVLKTLKDQHLEENTLVIFMSDNGAMENWYPKTQYNGAHGPNDVLGSNFPLKNWKASNYEGAIRVPAIAYWKNKLPHQSNNQFIAISDIMPTILKLTGESQFPKNVEGKNVWESIKSKHKDTDKVIYIRGHKQECLIEAPFKLIRKRFKDGSPADYKLYNIILDPEETTDIITQETAVVNRMKQLLEKEFLKDDITVNVPLK